MRNIPSCFLACRCIHVKAHTHLYANMHIHKHTPTCMHALKKKDTKLETTMPFMACLASEATKCHLRHIPAFRCPVTASSSHLMGEELSSKSPGKDSREAVDILQSHQVLCWPQRYTLFFNYVIKNTLFLLSTQLRSVLIVSVQDSNGQGPEVQSLCLFLQVALTPSFRQ